MTSVPSRESIGQGPRHDPKHSPRSGVGGHDADHDEAFAAAFAQQTYPKVIVVQFGLQHVRHEHVFHDRRFDNRHASGLAHFMPPVAALHARGSKHDGHVTGNLSKMAGCGDDNHNGASISHSIQLPPSRTNPPRQLRDLIPLPYSGPGNSPTAHGGTVGINAVAPPYEGGGKCGPGRGCVTPSFAASSIRSRHPFSQPHGSPSTVSNSVRRGDGPVLMNGIPACRFPFELFSAPAVQSNGRVE